MLNNIIDFKFKTKTKNLNTYKDYQTGKDKKNNKH